MKLLTERSIVFGDASDPVVHDAMAAHALMQAIVDEPELPGGMPEEMWDAICNDRDAATEAFRIVVRQTKEGITTRADEILAGWTGAGE